MVMFKHLKKKTLGPNDLSIIHEDYDNPFCGDDLETLANSPLTGFQEEKQPKHTEANEYERIKELAMIFVVEMVQLLLKSFDLRMRNPQYGWGL